MTEKGSDPKHISRVFHSLEHEQAQERNINEREDECQSEGVYWDCLGVILWLSDGRKIGGIHGPNERNERA